MSILSLFNIGISGLETAEQLLQVTGNNVTNSQTPDYTREQATLASVSSGTQNSTGVAGNGVQVTDITRSYNSFVNAQVNTENSNVSYWNNFNTAISQVQDIFNEASNAGISPAITTFFNDWQNVAQSPQDDTQRTTLISDAGNLSNSISTAAASLNNERAQLFTSSQTLAGQVNSIASQIAGLNKALSGDPSSLELEDQRDSLVKQLGGIVKVSSYQDPTSGVFSVFVGGIPLVSGNSSYNMNVTTDTSDNMHFYVNIAPNQANNNPGDVDYPDVTSLITSGQLASNIEIRDTKIPSYMNQLNAFAQDLADTTNYYQKQGYGLDSSTGNNFFQPLSQVAKYTSVDSVNGVYTSPNDTFTSGGTLSIKLGDNDTTPASVTINPNSTLQDVVNDINSQAGSKVTAALVNTGPAGTFTTTTAYTLTTDAGSVTVPPNTYTGTSLANYINTNGNAGINVTYDASANDFTIISSGATKIESPGTTIGGLLGFTFSGSPSIGSGITGSAPSPPDYRISIQSNPPGNVGNVRIGVTLNGLPPDAAGSGLNLLATSAILSNGTPGAPGAVISSVNITDPTQTVADPTPTDPTGTLLATDAQYKIDYNFSGGAGYQEDGTTGIYWRVMESTDGNTWTTINPNTLYNPSDPTTLNQNEVNLTPDSAGLSRTLEFNGIAVKIDGSGVNSTTNPNGETFAVQFNPNAALDMATNITNADQVAASSDTWNIDSSNNSVVFNVNGGSNITAVIPAGTYTNDPGQPDDISAALTSAIQTAYQKSTGSTLSDGLNVSFNPNTKQFNITMSNGSDSINFLWSNSASTANKVFGFSNDASLNSFVINAGNQTIMFNDGSGPQTANIPTLGSPYTGAGLAAAINGAMSDPNLSVAYNAATNNFTITNSGATAATIDWAIPQQFGFPTGTVNIPAAVGAVNGSVSSAAVGNSAASDNPASVETNADKGLPGDNTNAQNIANAANGTDFGGTTPTGFYMSLVSNIGVDASYANTTQQYHTTLLNGLTQQQQQISGVSMDQEASNLVIYQKSYEAAAQLITVGEEMLSTLLGLVK